MTPAATFESSAAAVEKSHPLPTYRHPRRLLVAGIVAGLFANAWFVDSALGVGFFLFAAGWVLGLRLLGGRESWQRAGAVRGLLAPLLACAAFVAVRDAPTLTALNVLCVLGLGCLSVQLFTGERALSSLGIRNLFGATFGGAFSGLFAGPVVASEAVDLRGAVDAARTHGKPMFRALLFVVPVLTLFGALLASADAVFSRMIQDRLDAFGGSALSTAVSNLLVVGGFTLVASGLWARALRKRAPAVEPAPAAGGFQLGAVESFAVVGSLLLLFAGFGAIQAACLFGAVALPAELTWAEYARQGFFQLLAVAGLTLALLTWLTRVTVLSAPARNLFRAACTSLVALTWLILASAVKRLTLYEDAYGFTELRVYSHVFAFALAGMLLWRAVTLWRWTRSFAIGALAGLVGFVLALDLLNPDALIARKNLERFAQTGSVDVFTLGSLSADATGELTAALDQLDAAQASALTARHATVTAPRRGGSWASANLARWDAAQAFSTAPPVPGPRDAEPPTVVEPNVE